VRSLPFKNAGAGVGPHRRVELMVWAWALVIIWSGRRYLRVVWVRVLVVVEAVGSHLCSSPLLHGGGHGCLLLFMHCHCQLLTLCGSGCRCHRPLPIWVLVVVVVWW